MNAPVKPNSRVRDRTELGAGRLPDLKALTERFKPSTAATFRSSSSLSPPWSSTTRSPRSPGGGGLKIKPQDRRRSRRLLLGELRLSRRQAYLGCLAATADKEGWPAARFLAALAEQEIVSEPDAASSNLAEARLPPGKTLDTFDFDAVPMISKAQVKALAAGDSSIKRA